MDVPTNTLSAVALFKNGTYAGAFLAGIAYLGVTAESIIILTVLIFTDLLFGVIRAGVIRGGGGIKSSIFERGLVAKCLIIAIPVNIALAGRGAGIDLSWIAQGTITTLIFSELYSIVGNMYCIYTGKEDRVEFDAVAAVLNQLKRLLRSFIDDN